MPLLVFSNQVVTLKVLTNEKRDGLRVVAFHKSPFKLFTLRFSSKSVQAPSYERPETTQRNLFLSFEINNCFPIMVKRRRLRKNPETCIPRGNSNIAIDALPTLQISVGFIALFGKIYYGDQIFTVISNNGEDIQYRYFN